MIKAVVVTPVKNSLETTLDTIEAIYRSNVALKHVVFNDFSDKNVREELERNQSKFGFDLVNLEDVIKTPSPNYDYVLRESKKLAISLKVPLIIIESDVIVDEDTIAKLLEFTDSNVGIGMVGAITVDEYGVVNFPYLKFKGEKNPIIKTERSLSFCCTLLSSPFLNSIDLNTLEKTKDWYDTIISKMSIENNFQNYVLTNVKVWHRPHGSRPWKQLKYTNPIKYYLQKFILGRDKI